VVLGAEDIAGSPSDLGTEIFEGLDEDCSLDGHMEGTTDSSALQDLFVSTKLLAAVHEAGHLSFSKFDLLVSKVSEVNVLDLKFVLFDHLGVLCF